MVMKVEVKLTDLVPVLSFHHLLSCHHLSRSDGRCQCLHTRTHIGLTVCMWCGLSEANVAGSRADLGLEVGADADDAPPGGHLKGKADHASDLQQSFFTQAPAALRTDKCSGVMSHLFT